MWALQCLPPEILLEILSHLPVDSLLTLSRTCHQFNSLCLPYFFSRHEIPNPSESFKFRAACTKSSHTVLPSDLELLKRENDPLSGLYTAFDVTSVMELLVIFHDCDTSHPTAAKLKPYWKLLHVLERLEYVKKLTIGFDYWYFDEQNSVEGDLAVQRKEVVTGLLNVGLERGCETLTIQNSDIYQRPPLAETSGLSGLLHNAKNLNLLRRGPERAIIPYAPLPAEKSLDFIPLVDSARKATNVQRLVISASMMLYPPCSYWTYSILDTPNLTSLCLYRIHLPTEHWEAAFSWLIHPLKNKLLDFTIMHSADIPVEALLTFLSSLNVLTHLKIILSVNVKDHAPLITTKRGSSPTPKGSANANGNGNSNPILPNLISLEAYTDWINLLFPHSLPRPTLQSLEIIPRAKFDFGKSIPELQPILTHPTLLPPHPNRHPNLCIKLNLHICGYTPVQFTDDFALYSDETHRLALGASVYDSITHLMIRLRVFSPEMVEKTPERICQFLGWWRNLEGIEFFTVANQWKETWGDVWTKERVGRFLEEVGKSCGKMRKVILNEVEYEVPREA